MIETLAASAVAMIVPYLGKAAEEAAKTVGKEGANAGLSVLSWLRGKVTGRTKEALEDAEKNPSDDNQADLRKQLTKLLDAQPALIDELKTLLPEASNEAVTQHQAVGEHGIGVQFKGDHNNVSIKK